MDVSLRDVPSGESVQRENGLGSEFVEKAERIGGWRLTGTYLVPESGLLIGRQPQPTSGRNNEARTICTIEL